MMDDTILRALLVLLVPTLLLTALNTRLVKEHHQAVIERMGAFHRIVGPGIHMLIPFYERMVETVPTTPVEATLGKTTITYIIKDLKRYCYAPRSTFESTLVTLLDACYPNPENLDNVIHSEAIDAQITSYMHTLGLEITTIAFCNVK